MRKGQLDSERSRTFDEFRDPEKIEEGGLLRISGAFILDHEEEILNLIKKEGKLEEQRNPNARIKKIEKNNGGISVETTHHSLAMHMGKSLQRAYKGEHKYRFLKGQKYVEVDWKRD